MFAFWRGSILYKFKVIKTPFHSGRIRVDLVPGGKISTGSNYVQEKCYSKIFDLREGTEFELCVPYVFNNPWKKLDVRSNDTDYKPTMLMRVSVLNALKNPTTCANNIEFLVETKGGKDLQFAYPALAGTKYVVGRSPIPINDHVKLPLAVNAQSGNDAIFPGKIDTTFDANAIGIGEVVLSLRQILKRYQKVFVDQLGGTSGAEVRPYAQTTELSLTVTPPQDPYSWITNLYRFISGSMRVAITSDDTGPSPSGITRITLRNDAVLPSSGTVLDAFYGPLNLQMRALEPFIELTVPFYQQWPAIPTGVGLPTDSTNDTNDAQQYNNSPSNRGTRIVFSNKDGTAASVEAYRAIGEDFCAGFLIGPALSTL